MESKSKVTILNELRKYNLGNRSMEPTLKSDGSNGKPICVYNSPEGNHCGVGQYLKPEYQTESFIYNSGSSAAGLQASHAGGIDHWLIPEVHGHIVDFWADVQFFHDDQKYFTEVGLSEAGEYALRGLISKWE